MKAQSFKIILVNPRFKEITTCLPIGLAYIAAYAKKKGFHNIEALDANTLDISTSDLADLVLTHRPNLVGIAASTITINESWEILKKIKEKDNSILTVLGGVHPTSLPEESLNKTFVDFVVRGEGEETFACLLSALSEGKDLAQIDGLSFKQNGNIIMNRSRQLIKNLDDLPFPDRTLFPFPDKYRSPLMKGKSYATIFTSRGCPGRCIFCNKNVFKSIFRPRSPKNVVDEIKYLYQNYKIREFHFADECFSWDVERAEQICQDIIERKLKILWAVSTGMRVDKITDKLLKKMRESGCYRVALGVESGSARIIEKINKGIDLTKVKSIIANAQKEGIITTVFFIIGNYGDDLKSMHQTIEFAKELNTDFAQFTMNTPFPGTALYKIVEREGRFLTKDWSKYGVYKESVFEMGDLTAELMKEMYAKSYRQFYWRPRQLLKISFHICKNINLHILIRMFRNFLEVVRRSLKRDR